MNFAPCLSTVFCAACAAECHFEELHAEHIDLCSTCGDDLAVKLAADEAEELATDDEIISEWLKCGESELAEAAARADRRAQTELAS